MCCVCMQYGESLLCLEDCELYYCRLAVALGNKCNCLVAGCDLKDCGKCIFQCVSAPGALASARPPKHIAIPFVAL